jgi:hypothetical protein
MKFLVSSRLPIDRPAPEDFAGVLQACREYIDTALAEGRLDCVYMYIDGRKSILIANADSHEELLHWLLAHPAYPDWEWEAHPLSDVHHFLDTLMAGLS